MIASNFVRLAMGMALLATAACGGAGAPVADRSTNGSVNGTSSEATTGQRTRSTSKPKSVPSAPINIPPIFNKQGRPIDEVRSEVEAQIRDACGDGTLCVTVAVAQGDNDTFTQCQYDTSDPQSFSDQEQFTLERGSTLTLLTGPGSCETTTTETTTTETTDETSAESTPQQSSDVEPSP